MIWDLSSDEEVLLTIIKEKDNEFHTDVVRYLTWKADRNNTMLVTGGRDGKIIFWKVTISTLTFKAKERSVEDYFDWFPIIPFL